MKNKNEKGFALVLALLLLLVMSLMGGSLIVIASGDHKSNNNSDQYQQAFYVAEMGLLQAEKRIINQFKGEVKDDGTRNKTVIKPVNTIKIIDAAGGEDCYKSFKNIDPDTLEVTDHITDQNFGVLISPIVTNTAINDLVSYKKIESGAKTIANIIDDELAYLKRFEYEYFTVNIGEAPLMVSGSSINVGQKDSMQLGTAYKLYACGIFYGRSILGTANHNSSPQIIIPLESIIIMPN